MWQFELAVAVSLAGQTSVFAADWAQWRGPTRDGISTETGWTYHWGPAGPRVLWKRGFGTGCSSFTAVGNRVYTMGNRDETDTVCCLDAATGKMVWEYSYAHPLDPNMFEGGPGSTPVIDGPRVYTLSRHGRLFCLVDGKVVWAKHLVNDLGGEQPRWGYAGSPLVLGDTLLLDVGGRGCSAMALNKLTGEVFWKAGDDSASYSSPVVIKPGDNPSVAFFNVAGLVVRAARDGQELWRFPLKSDYDVNAASPLPVGNAVFISSSYGHSGALVRPATTGPKVAWQSKAMRNKLNSSVLWQGYLYGFDEESLACLAAATGEVKWKQSGLSLGSLILAAGKLVIMSEKGRLVIAEASPEQYRLLADAQVLSDKRCWVVPTLANGRIFCKNNFGDAVAVDVRGP